LLRWIAGDSIVDMQAHPTQPRELAPGPGRKIAPTLLASGVALALLATIVVWGLHPSGQLVYSKVVIGAKDQVYYSHAATKEDAELLGQALKGVGFFNSRGTIVLLSKGKSAAAVSFALQAGAWDHPETVFSFEEIARRVAPAIGGFPITVRLCDAVWSVHKELAVGKVMVGARDEIYYFGPATEADAEALGQALKSAGFLVDAGASVVLSKDGGAAISFVVGDGVWERPDAVAGFERLARRVAASVGGLPVKLALLDSKMEAKKEVPLR
jgi:hypothetical protein